MVTKTGSLMAAVAALAVGAMALAAPAQAADTVKVGVLSCNVSSGWGFVFGSTRDLRCTYAHDKGAPEHYVGHISKFGVDIGYQAGGVIVWGVFAPASDLDKGALAGQYGGVTASASAGAGGGANVLLGGFQRSITLQPISIEGTSGVNVAAGIAQVSLKFKP
jgi:hypothetical protein